jgi:hypothetical protein
MAGLPVCGNPASPRASHRSEERVPPSDRVAESKAEDARLVARAKEGDVASFERLFHKYERRIYNLIYRMVSDRET